jgi:hypothetical protein
MARIRHRRDPLVLSILDIPRAQIAERIYGSAEPKYLRRVKAWFSGRKPITLAQFWELYRAFPVVDLARSMQDLYDRQLLARARKNMLTTTSESVSHGNTLAEGDP